MPFHSSSRVMEKPPAYRNIPVKLGIPQPVDKCSDSAVRTHSAIPRRLGEINEEHKGECEHVQRRLQREEKDILLERSISLNEMRNVDGLTSRSMSASNLMALSDPNLCLTVAAPKRDYNSADTVFAKRRLKLTSLIHTYYHQLTQGCGSTSCLNLFCASNARLPRRSSGAAVLISVELASQGPFNLCKNGSHHQTIVPPKDAFVSCSKQTNATQPFMERLFSATPFRCVFLSSPMSPLDHIASNRTLNSSQSLSCLHLSKRNDINLDDNDRLTNNHSKADASFSVMSTIRYAVNYVQSILPSILSNQSEENSENASDNTSWLFGPTTAVNQDNLKYFENTTAQKIRANRLPVEDSFSLSHLSLEMLYNVLTDLKECKDPTFLHNTIRTVFSSSCHLNSSFTASDGNLIIEDVKKGFDSILQHDCPDYGLIDVLHATLEIHLLGLSHLPSLPNANTNQLIIALLVPNIAHNATLSLALCKVLRNINGSEKDHMTSVLVAIEIDALLHMQQGFQNLLSLSLAKGRSFGSYQTSICSALDLLFSTCRKHPECSTETLQMFCNPALSKAVDTRSDFAKYCISRKAVRSGQSNNNDSHRRASSFFDFPFLLEPLYKIKAIHLHAMNQMRIEYSNAIVQQSRVQKVQKTLDISSHKILVSSDVYSSMCPYLLLEIRRSHLVEDALLQVHTKVADLKKPLKVRYVKGGEFGLDMGGLQKEFFQLATEHLFADDFGMFVSCEGSRASWINADSLESPLLYEFVGILIGLAIYNGIILGVRFPMAFYKKLLEQPMNLDDLKEIEPSIAQSLKLLLTLDSEELNDLGLTFQVFRQSCVSKETVVVHDLILDGDQVPVNIHNRSLFVNLYVHLLLDSCIKTQFLSILSGLHQVCDDEVFKLFRADELELLICGSADLDFKALKSTTVYRDGYTADHHTIKDFWQIVESFSDEQKQKLLMFVTGSSRVPLDGLKSLAFHIQRNGPDTDNLPTAMTCFNRLLLPEYNSIDRQRCKLSLAIENSKGFGLT